MSADDHLSPSQFGFKPVDRSEYDRAIDLYDEDKPHGGGVPGRIDPHMELHTAQRNIWPEVVSNYTQKPGLRSMMSAQGSRVEVYHHEGKVYLGEGHHRTLAARARGQKSMRVMHYGLDS